MRLFTSCQLLPLERTVEDSGASVAPGKGALRLEKGEIFRVAKQEASNETTERRAHNHNLRVRTSGGHTEITHHLLQAS